jgi:hypothetical protein
MFAWQDDNKSCIICDNTMLMEIVLELEGKGSVSLHGIHGMHEALLDHVLCALVRSGFFPHEVEHAEAFDLQDGVFTVVPLTACIRVNR